MEYGQSDGVAYISRSYARQKYSHLRGLLQRSWEILDKPESERFVIDVKFKQEIGPLCQYLNKEIPRHILNEAHRQLVAQYKNGARGRPIGALNKSTIEAYGRDEAAELVAESKKDPTEEEIASRRGFIVTTPQDKDMSQYVTRIELELDLRRVAEGLETEIKNYIEPRYNAHVAAIEALGKAIEQIGVEVEKIETHRPTIIHLQPAPDLPVVDMGVQHRNFPILLSMCNSRKDNGLRHNIWVYGPAGTGKSRAAEEIFKALGLKPYAMGALETGYQVLGYKDANGVYVSTLFRECWEHGGGIMLDEVDSYSPSAALALNNMLANGIGSFPDGMVKRHPDCLIVAGANTTGLGGTWEYTGRMKQDAAFCDRWDFLEWPLDEALEASLCGNTDWLEYVRKVRAAVAAKQIKGVMITPRASINGASLLNAGVPWDYVVKACLRKGMSETQWQQVA